MEKGLRLASAFEGRNRHVSLQAAHRTETEPAGLQRPSGGNPGRSQSHEQGHWPWYACSAAHQLSEANRLGTGCPPSDLINIAGGMRCFKSRFESIVCSQERPVFDEDEVDIDLNP